MSKFRKCRARCGESRTNVTVDKCSELALIVEEVTVVALSLSEETVEERMRDMAPPGPPGPALKLSSSRSSRMI